MSARNETHAAALWHTLWFHALEASRTADGPDLMTTDEGTAFDMDAGEVREYNEWQLTRDFAAERARHVAVVAAMRHVYGLMGITLPDDDTIIGCPTWDVFKALVAP